MAILSYTHVARLEQALPQISEFEEMCRHYREHSGRELSDELLAGKLLDILSKELSMKFATDQALDKLSYVQLKQ